MKRLLLVVALILAGCAPLTRTIYRCHEDPQYTGIASYAPGSSCDVH